MKLSVDFSRPIRPVGKLNGMNNGPITTFSDRTAEFKEIGVDFVRFHETHALTAKCVEIPFIFRDFDADENDPKNYFFGETDAVIKGAYDAGIEIMYRFGMGTDAVNPKYFLQVPKDFKKWARICMHIMDHYNNGWANGFHYNIRYWEIWNEADLSEYWQAPYNLFIEFYSTVAPMLKEHDPKSKIGPCGFSTFCNIGRFRAYYPGNEESNKERLRFYRALLSRIKDDNIPFDFFAWHYYYDFSWRTHEILSIIENLLSESGFLDKVELINTEWNGMRIAGAVGGWDMNQMTRMQNATATVATMMLMQRHNVSKAAYYDTEDYSSFNGLFGYGGEIRRHFYCMKAFNLLREGKTEVYSDFGNPSVQICASYNGKKGVILLTNEGERETIKLDIKNLPSSKMTKWLFDESHNLEAIAKEQYQGGIITVDIPTATVIALEFDL